MHIVLFIAGIILGLIVLLLIAALFIKKDYTIVRDIVINKPKQDVFNYIRLLKNSANYNKWWRVDPNVRMTYSGTDGQVGFIAAWDSDLKSAGAGEQEVTEIREAELLDYEIRFFRPFKGVAQSQISTTAKASDQTLVKWQFSSRMNYPMNIMRVFVNFEHMLGRDQEQSLQLLKQELEK